MTQSLYAPLKENYQTLLIQIEALSLSLEPAAPSLAQTLLIQLVYLEQFPQVLNQLIDHLDQHTSSTYEDILAPFFNQIQLPIPSPFYETYPELNPLKANRVMRNILRCAQGLPKENQLKAPDRLSHILEYCKGRTGKKKQGIFYTTQHISAYICEQAIGMAISSQFKIAHPQALKHLRNPHTLSSSQHKNWKQFLSQLTVCDPACGTGNFLVETFRALQDWGLPPNALVGMDLDPVATKLCKLRLWSLSPTAHRTPSLWHTLEIHPGNALLPPKNSNQLKLCQISKTLGKTKSGFDIVLGNPPYLGEKSNQAIFAAIAQGPLKKHYKGKMDLLYFFFHLGVDLLKEGGQLAYITSNYYPTATYARHLREDLKSRTWIRKLFNFPTLSLFPHAQGHHSLITFLEKTPLTQNTELQVCSQSGQLKASKIIELLNTALDRSPSFELTPDELFYGAAQCISIQPISKQGHSILKKLRSLPLCLGDLCQINQGIVTGADRYARKHPEIQAPLNSGIFVLNKNEIKTLSIEDQTLLKPWYKNSHISPWVTAPKSECKLIYSSREVNGLPKILLEHLQPFKPLLEQRREVRKKVIQWWQLQWPRHAQIFEGPKIVAPQRHKKNCFAYVEKDFYTSADVYFIHPKSQENISFILSWLNSPLCYFWLWHYGKRKGPILELYQEPLKNIPIPIPSQKLRFRLSETEKPEPSFIVQIEKQLYRLLNLSTQEIAYVSQFVQEKLG